MPDVVVIFRAHSDVEADLVKGLLEAHGIFSFRSSDVPHSVFPLNINGLGEVRLTVHTRDAEAASRIIADYRKAAGRAENGGPDSDTRELERRLGYRFRDPELIERALTHRSRAHEEGSGELPDNESLEFLGDAILGFVIADLLFRRFPTNDEGRQSKLKASLVSTTTLARLSAALQLGDHLILGRGEEKTGGRQKHAILADTLEALIAAIYLDGGIDAARGFIERQFAGLMGESELPGFLGRDYKSALQEHLQARSRPLPEYRVAAESGPDHRKLFQVEVTVDGDTIAEATGRSKKEAEQEAARLALERLAVNAEVNRAGDG
jgi:ribonuclease III